MKNIVQQKRITYRPGSLNWFYHYSVSIMLFFFGTLNIFIFDTVHLNNLFLNYFIHLTPLLLGIILFYVQKKKLDYTILNTSKNSEQIRISIRELLAKNDWIIINDTQTFIYATRRKKGLFLGSIAFRFDKKSFKYNLNVREIVDPFTSLISINYAGRKLIGKLKHLLSNESSI